jgi:outer membrane receptor protein involved in Fe transport
MMSSFRRREIARAVALLAVLTAQQARAADPDVVAVVEIVAAAPQSGLGIDRKLLPYAVQTAGSGAVRRAESENLAGFMAHNLTGVNVNDISGSPFQSDVTFRGFRASPVLGTAQGLSVYLDGVRVNEPFGDVVNWDMLPEAAIGNLQLVPGSNPLYGLNTLGGALALTSKSGLSDPGLEASLSSGNNGQRRADLAYGLRSEDDWHAFIAATLFDDTGWRDHSAGRLGNAFVKLGRKHGPTEWSLALLGGDSHLIGNGLLPSYRWGDGGLSNGLYEADRRAAYTFPDETHNRLRQATLNLSHRLDERSVLSATAYLRNSRRDAANGDLSGAYSDYVDHCSRGFDALGGAIDPVSCKMTRAEGAALHTASLNTSSTRQDSQGVSAHLSARRARHQFDAGATFDRNTVSYAQFEQAADFTPERGVLADPLAARQPASSVVGAARTAGLYLADTWSVTEASHVTASARFNHARVSNTLTNDNGLQAPESFTYRKLNPALGIAHDAGGGLTLSANLSQSNRVPTVIELGCADPAQPCRLPVGLQSDPYLRQVVARTLEAGARWQGGGVAWSAALYRTINRDDILFRSAGPTQQGYFSNFSRTLHQGMDLSASRQWGAFAIRLGYSYLDAVYDANGQLFTGARNVQVTPGTRIAGLPRHTLKLGVDWKAAPALTLGGDVLAVSDLLTQGNEDGLRADPVAGQPPQYADWRIRGYALLNLRASYRPDRHWEFFARINNVADRRYETYGALAADMFPNGQLLRPQDGALEAGQARFVAPGAPRSVVLGLRYHF